MCLFVCLLSLGIVADKIKTGTYKPSGVLASECTAVFETLVGGSGILRIKDMHQRKPEQGKTDLKVDEAHQALHLFWRRASLTDENSCYAYFQYFYFGTSQCVHIRL